MPLIFLVLILSTSLLGCRSEEQRVREVTLNFVESHETLNAPVRAYTFLTEADKAAVSMNNFRAAFPPTEGFLNGTVAVSKVDVLQNAYDVTVELRNQAKDALVEHHYLIVRDGDRLRVKLGLGERKQILDRIAQIERETDLVRARTELDELLARPTTFSRPQAVIDALERVDVELQEKERVADLQRDVDRLRPLNGDDLRSGLAELKPLITEKDAKIERQWQELFAAWKLNQAQTYLAALDPPKFRMRRVNRDGTLSREVLVWLTNNTPVALENVVFNLAYKNEEEGEPLGTIQQSALKDGALPAGEEREFVFALDPGPEGWKGRFVGVSVASLSFLEKQ
ncbi:MAG: hypothetical protein R3E66_20330 [bacterium]